VSMMQKIGPNAQLQREWTEGSYNFALRGYVLHLRGAKPVQQPIQDPYGNLLCFNGEIFNGLSIGLEDNDALVLSERLSGCETDVEILSVFESIKGPYAFVYWQVVFCMQQDSCVYSSFE
jgi:asparagine synthetase B (glutamine-hydrolysing)